jgi:MtN3 and saliva related transmembrane protein
MEIFKIITSVVGVLMSFGYYPQAYRIWKLKSAKELSLVNYCILSVGTTLWFIYGIIINDPVIIAGFIAGAIGSWLVLALVIRYRKAGG